MSANALLMARDLQAGIEARPDDAGGRYLPAV